MKINTEHVKALIDRRILSLEGVNPKKNMDLYRQCCAAQETLEALKDDIVSYEYKNRRIKER